MKTIVFLLLLVGTTAPLFGMEEIFRAEAEWRDRCEELTLGSSKRNFNCLFGMAFIAGGIRHLLDNRQNITWLDIGAAGAYFAAGLACFSKNDLFLHRENPYVVRKLETLRSQAKAEIKPQNYYFGNVIINNICSDRVIAFPKEVLQQLYDKSYDVSCVLESKRLKKWDTIEDTARDYYFYNYRYSLWGY